MGWLIKSIKNNYKLKQITKKKGHIKELDLGQRSNLIQLNKRFYNIFLFTSLKLFRHFIKTIQQPRNKQKTIVKESITTATSLLIQNILKTIYYILTIFDFIILVQYLLQNDETLFYIEHFLYKLDKIKIAFDNYCPINAKLF